MNDVLHTYIRTHIILFVPCKLFSVQTVNTIYIVLSFPPPCVTMITCTYGNIL